MTGHYLGRRHSQNKKFMVHISVFVKLLFAVTQSVLLFLLFSFSFRVDTSQWLQRPPATWLVGPGWMRMFLSVGEKCLIDINMDGDDLLCHRTDVIWYTLLPSNATVLIQPERTICRSLRLVQACLLFGFSVQDIWPYLSGSAELIALICECPGCLGISAKSRFF